MNFWTKLNKPIFILAPMDGVTDTVFRQIVTSIGKPDIFFTEFVSVDALCSSGKQKALERLKFDKKERPIVAQIWGSNPDRFYKAAQLISKLGFDGIDINMGCPVDDVIKTGSCSALIENHQLAGKIIEATLQGAGLLPVSVKTRIGFKTIETEDWVSFLLKYPLSALTLHLRTKKEMSKVPAHWEQIEKAVKIRDELGSQTLIIGNGDIKSLDQARKMVDIYQINGAMIGRGIFDNVWFFNKNIKPENIRPQMKLDLLLKHLELYKKTWGDKKPFEPMKKFIKCYTNNFPGAFELRQKLMCSISLDELIQNTRLASRGL